MEKQIFLSLRGNVEKVAAVILLEEGSYNILLKFSVYTGKEEDLFRKIQSLLPSRGKWEVVENNDHHFRGIFSNLDRAIWTLRHFGFNVTEIQ